MMNSSNNDQRALTAQGEQFIRSQQIFYEEAWEAIAKAQKSRRTRFEAHRPASEKGLI